MQIVLYAPLALFYLQVVSRQFLGGGQALHIGFWQVCRSVLIFEGIPDLHAVLCQSSCNAVGLDVVTTLEQQYDAVLNQSLYVPETEH